MPCFDPFLVAKLENTTAFNSNIGQLVLSEPFFIGKLLKKRLHSSQHSTIMAHEDWQITQRLTESEESVWESRKAGESQVERWGLESR